MDSRGVAEYIRALVITNAIAEYLPDEQTGKPSSLPTLVFFLSACTMTTSRICGLVIFFFSLHFDL